MTLAILLVLTQAAIARGDLRKLARWSDQLALEVRAEGRGNLLAPPALRELRRWPGLVTLELRGKVTKAEALQLRGLGRFAARVPARDASLKLLAPALVRVETAPLEPQPLGCRDAQEDAVLLQDGADGCALAWLSRRLTLRPEPPEK